MTKSEKKVLQSDPVDDKNSAASLAELFSQAATYDYFLMMAGTIGGIVTGLSLPIFNVLFGKALDALNTNPNSLSTSINNLALLFVYIGCANLVSGTLQVACWSITGERQTQKFREVYVKSILSQEIGWFDICGAGELSTKVADLCGKISGKCEEFILK
jgi:ATP-binding cassette subfamily B (MDR/TAP) protein 1